MELDFSPIFFPDLETYKNTLPRRKKKRSNDDCCGLSSASWVFLLLALLQGILVTGLQVTIVILGRGKLDRYVECLEESLLEQFNATVLIPVNSTIPTFGEDKKIYAFFFIALVVYNFVLLLYALKYQNIVEVYSFMVSNSLSMIYAGVQIYQFRGFGAACDTITLVGYLALANALVLLVFTSVFLFLSLFIYVEFGWKTYLLVDCNPAMRYYYRVYQLFMSVLKLVILFLVIFSVAQCVLILTTDNYEFYITIIIAIVSILALPLIYLIVTSESKVGAALILLLGIALMAYFIFKIARYAARSCPLCVTQVNNINSTREIIEQIIIEQIGMSEGTLNLDFLERAQDFENLIIIAGVNLLFTVFAVIMFLHYLRQYNKGLKSYFAERPFNKFVHNLFCHYCNKRRYNVESTDT